MTVPSLAARVAERIAAAAAEVVPDAAGFDPGVRRSEHADLQADGLLALASARGANPRDLAAAVASRLPRGGAIAGCAVAGPGFLNLTVPDAALLAQVGARLADIRLGAATPEAGTTTVVDYSQPNVAKEMHVGHLRSTVIGDALVRILEFLGGTVLRQNHIGDWGTQFGMLIEYLMEHEDERWHGAPDGGITRLGALYQRARTRFDADAEFADRARRRVVALQAGDPATREVWREIVAESTVYFSDVYARLGVRLTPADAVGESFYNPQLGSTVDELVRLGVAALSDGALCVFFDGVTGPGGAPVPLIVRKRDGGYGYAATDLAALRYRVGTLHADRVVYVVDARQAMHLRMVFDTATRAGWLPATVEAVHVPFGTVLGKDGRPFRTREGATVRLVDLLSEAVDRARAVVAAKNPGLDPATLERRARAVGVGAVKYADLSTSRTKNYVFDPDRMVSLTGNTGVYLQYAHARTRSILAKAGEAADAVDPEAPLADAERRLALHLDGFADTVAEAAATFEPHRLCTYLFALAQAYTAFHETCPVLKAPPDLRGNRLALCRLTAETLRTGLDLLGIEAPAPL